MGGSGGAAGRDDPITEINVTPLVDICLVLVIIFMVTVPIMMAVSPFNVELPKADTLEPREDVNITICLTATDSVSVDEKKCKWEELPDMLKAKIDEKGTDKMIIIRADKEVYHQRTLEIMDLVKKLGGERMSFATLQKS
ncbi:MAG: biopolymer transporter ExbD [Candidatus Stahlbacteria bacterium]|nr:biopolymer transporter ExbD [Candidatus Stahlbacteria bacterium]